MTVKNACVWAWCTSHSWLSHLSYLRQNRDLLHDLQVINVWCLVAGHSEHVMAIH